MGTKKRTDENETVKNRADEDGTEEFFKAFLNALNGKDDRTGASETRLKRPKNNKSKSESRTTQKTRTPKTGAQSVIELGYGPINMKYDTSNPRGLWDKIRKGEVSEIYLGDGVGSTYVKNPKPWDNAMGAAKARENGTAVFANPNTHKKEDDDSQFSEFLKGFGGDGSTKRRVKGGHF